MGGLMTRGYLDGDAPAVAALLNRIKVHAGGHPYLIADELQSRVSTMVRDHAEDARVLFVDGELVAFGGVPTPPSGGFKVDLMGGVDPRWRGRSIGRDLLDWQLRRAAEIHAAVAPERDWEIHIGTADGDADAKRLYRRFGLAPVRYWFQMATPTTMRTTQKIRDLMVAFIQAPGPPAYSPTGSVARTSHGATPASFARA